MIWTVDGYGLGPHFEFTSQVLSQSGILVEAIEQWFRDSGEKGSKYKKTLTNTLECGNMLSMEEMDGYQTRNT